ncbi:MAG: polysaccharide biosynthesis PFTS motif protein, partial [Methanomicrobiales archaeon]|nr:polysaccharide biosynthesis PFTS motif protein [Methanomicrobiales archaeon]
MQDRSPLSPEAPGGSPSPRDSPGPGLAIFERIGFFNRFAAAWYLARGYRVRYLDMAAPVPGWSRPGQEQDGRLERIRWGNLDLHHQFALNNEVLRGIDEAFRQELGSSRLIGLLGDLVGTEKARDAYLKYLALNRYDQALKAYQLTETGVRDGGGRDPVMILSDPLLPGAILAARGTGSTGFRVPRWNRFFLSLRWLGEKAGYLGILALLPLYLLAKVGIPSRAAPAPRASRLGIRVYRTDFGSHRRYRSVDFLVDGKGLHPGNTLICVETPLAPLTREALGKKGYRIAEVDRSLRGVPLGFLRGCILGRGIPFWARCLPAALGEAPSTIRQTLEFFLTYLLWEAFFTRHGLSQYVTYNDTLPKDVIRNLVFARHGVQTWYYEHSSNTSNLFVPEGREEHAAVLYAYLNYDHLVAWGDKVRRFYELHPQRVG